MARFRLKKKTKGGQVEEEIQGGAIEAVTPVQPHAAKVPQVGVERGTVRLTLAVPRSLHTRLKLVAVRQEQSIVSLVSGWIEEKTVPV